jgi:predicted anti-sigma-YlaC factor YlaD
MEQHVYHLLDDYYDNELSPMVRRRVEAHLDACASCRAELERLNQLGDLLAEYRVPDAFSAAEIFQAQVVLRVARRTREQSGYEGAVWHLVPLALLSLVVVLQALFVLVGALGRVFRSAQWLGADVGSFLTQLGIAWPETLAILGLSPSTTVVTLGVVLMFGLYLGGFVLLIPYVGWVGALWRSSRAGQTSLGR